MHYGKSHFSKAPYNLTTIRTLDPLYQDVIGQRTVLSARDVEKVNLIYNCGNNMWYLQSLKWKGSIDKFQKLYFKLFI